MPWINEKCFKWYTPLIVLKWVQYCSAISNTNIEWKTWGNFDSLNNKEKQELVANLYQKDIRKE